MIGYHVCLFVILHGPPSTPTKDSFPETSQLTRLHQIDPRATGLLSSLMFHLEDLPHTLSVVLSRNFPPVGMKHHKGILRIAFCIFSLPGSARRYYYTARFLHRATVPHRNLLWGNWWSGKMRCTEITWICRPSQGDVFAAASLPLHCMTFKASRRSNRNAKHICWMLHAQCPQTV